MNRRMSWIESGNPAVNPLDASFFKAESNGFPLRYSKLMAFSSTYRPGMTIEEDDSLRRLFNTNADSMAIFGKRSAFTIILYKLLCVRWSIHWTICAYKSTSQMKKSEQLHKRTRYLFLFLCFLKILLQFSFHSL